jgi:hypothetical protein
MTAVTYAIYPPSKPGLPFLAVAIRDQKPVAALGCWDERSAERLLQGLKGSLEVPVEPPAS